LRVVRGDPLRFAMQPLFSNHIAGRILQTGNRLSQPNAREILDRTSPLSEFNQRML
jgi:hypothetical protein